MRFHHMLLSVCAGILLSASTFQIARTQNGQPHPLSPGAVVGSTWFDEQDKGSSSRRVELKSAAGREIVHHAWFGPDTTNIFTRVFYYGLYDAAEGAYGGPFLVRPGVYRAGYLDLSVTGDNRAVIAGHEPKGSAITPTVYWDSAAASGVFSYFSRPPDSVVFYAIPRNRSLLWPRSVYVEGSSDTVLHVLAHKDKELNDPMPLYYLRRIGSERDPSAHWDYPPRIVDTTYAWAVHQVAATPGGRVALAWMANVPCSGDPDTISGTYCADSVEWDNDLYLQISNDYGTTWQPRQNLTRYSADPESRHRAHSEVSALFSETGELHLTWAAAAWPRVAPGPNEVAVSAGALFHWAEYSGITSLIYDFDWNQTNCDGGTHALNIGDVSLAECRGRLFVLFAQFNDPLHGITDDCAIHPTYPHGAAIPDLCVAVSSDGGLCWDAPRNLTNSHTPGCDSIGGIGGPCAAESWPSMNRHGSDLFIDPAISGADIIVPAGGVDPGWYLDVQYIDDPSPDFSLYGQSFEQIATVRWFRMACVDPILTADLVVAPDSVLYPNHAPNCAELNVPVVLQNLGNGAADYTVTAEEQIGPAGWLAPAGFAGVLPVGPAGSDTGYALINAGGAICSPGGITHLVGRLRFDSNSPQSPQYVAIDLVVADTVCTPSIDTLSTACLSLAVRNDGGCGGRGTERVAMDYVDAGDCDPLAGIYLQDASPIVACIDGIDTMVNWSAYECDYLAPHGLVPLESSASTEGAFNSYRALSATRDTSLLLDVKWYAPLHADTCQFLVQRMLLYSGDGAPHTVALGQIVDWNIPSDSGGRNGSDTLSGMPLIYQFGGEFHQDPGACQDNDRRFGAVFPLGMFRRGNDYVPIAPDTVHIWPTAQTRANSGWCASQPCGLEAGEVVAALTTPGWALHQPPVPDSTLVDLHTLVAFASDYLLQPGETLVVFTGFATVQNGDAATLRATADMAREWYCGHLTPDPAACGCCRLRADANHDGKCIVSDLTYMVSFLFRGGAAPICEDEGDANGDGSVKISDVTYLVSYLFRGGAVPPGC